MNDTKSLYNLGIKIKNSPWKTITGVLAGYGIFWGVIYTLGALVAYLTAPVWFGITFITASVSATIVAFATAMTFLKATLDAVFGIMWMKFFRITPKSEKVVN